jgi:hypothetical protein
MSKNQNPDADKKFDAKFDFLAEQMNKSNLNDNKLLQELDNMLENKYSSFVTKLKEKIQTKCKNEIERLQVYTQYDGKLFKSDKDSSLNDLKPSPGYEKDFEDAMGKFKECVEPITFLEADINKNSNTVTNLTLFSHETCLEECRKDMKKFRHSEYEVKKCLESCMRYRKYNFEAYSKIIYDDIESKQKILEKI